MMVLYLQKESPEPIEYHYESIKKFFFMDLIKSDTWLRDEVITLTFKFINKITNLVQLHVYIFYTTTTNLVPINCEFAAHQPDFTVGSRESSIFQALVPSTRDYGFIFLGMMLTNFFLPLYS